MTIPDNPHIQGAFFKALGYLDATKNIVVSVSGGSDSDIITDFIYQCGFSDRVKFIFMDTGLEYSATKEHIGYLEKRYNITIERIKAKKTIPRCCKEYGQPFISKFTSHMIEGLQRHNFQWEDGTYKGLTEKYPNCKSYIKWWTNNNEKNQWNISYNKFLKEFIIDNPPDFPISFKCCEYSKKQTAKDYYTKNNVDVVVTGLRQSEGGIRASVYKSCYTTSRPDTYRPIWWFTNTDKAEYMAHYGIKNSRCYSEYGFKRTGCACCPFVGRGLEWELCTTAKYEPKLYRAVNSVFGKSYEYTRAYYEYRANRENQVLRDKLKTPALDAWGII